jgi:hypothetical protein
MKEGGQPKMQNKANVIEASMLHYYSSRPEGTSSYRFTKQTQSSTHEKRNEAKISSPRRRGSKFEKQNKPKLLRFQPKNKECTKNKPKIAARRRSRFYIGTKPNQTHFLGSRILGTLFRYTKQSQFFPIDVICEICGSAPCRNARFMV